MRELFRLSEDEAAVIQLYRLLTDDTKAAILSLIMIQAEQANQQANQQADNVVAFAASMLNL